MKKFKVYVDTSVFGGVFDDRFSDASLKFFDLVRTRYLSLVTSVVVRDEIQPAPEQVREYFASITADAEVADINQEALSLRNAYLDARIVTEKSSDDALHVALATVTDCKLIVSWNFKHIVNFEKIPLYNAVNALNGFSNIAIFSPMEVVKNEDNDN
ncbi:MAG: type II toxin-antitoxin system VapC family toxin [Deltaproteobacteria bacterium]|nr:type II toxin-antitoxin system VapC family toxin [Deltaproteobacteria bacterium]